MRIAIMARRCALTGKGVLVGNNVSHANNKTKRRFLPNLRQQRLYSEALAVSFRLRISNYALRTVEQRGGLDNYLLAERDCNLSGELRRLKRRIEAVRSPMDAPAAA
jgi:large subunit ribosomal protein L28